MKINSIKTLNGFSLLEVLISVFILAVGLLGLASLQINSLKNNHSAQFRTSATLLAYDLIDRVRLNPKETYSLTMTKTPPTGTTDKEKNLAEWINQITTDLPDGHGEVVDDGRIITVSVQWDDSRASGSDKQTISVSSERLSF